MSKKILFILVGCCIILASASSLFAKDFQSPHRLRAGQTLSADVLNEVIDALSFSEKIPTRDDLLGTWSCKVSLCNNPYTPMEEMYPTYDFVVEQGLIYTYTGTIEFTKDVNGNYYVNDPHPKILDMDVNTTIINKTYAVSEGILYYNTDRMDITDLTTVTEVSLNGSNQLSLTYGAVSKVCNKTNIPPEIPEETVTSVAGNSITLSCRDRSENETGFVVLRRDKLDGDWQEIDTVDPVAGIGTTLTYTDTNLPSGTYWYRVKAVNAHGKSLGSNVSKVVIP